MRRTPKSILDELEVYRYNAGRLSGGREFHSRTAALHTFKFHQPIDYLSRGMKRYRQ
jgi:hypothetical protein